MVGSRGVVIYGPLPHGAGFIIRRVDGVSALWTNSFPVAALSAVSRKLHAGAPFDVPLPLSGTPGVEMPLWWANK